MKRVTRTPQIVPTVPPISIQKRTIEVQGKKFQVTTEIRTHDCLWALSKGVQAFFLTLLSLGIGLFFPQVRNKWAQAFSGKEVIETREELFPASRKTSRHFQRALKKEQETPRTPRLDLKRPAAISHTPTHGKQALPVRYDSEPLHAEKYGITVGSLRGKRAFFMSLPNPEAQKGKRDAVKRATEEATRDAQVPQELQEHPPRLFVSQDSQNTFRRDTQLFGRFDSIAVPCRMNYDYNWDPIADGQLFWAQHGAAPNIGESHDPTKVEDYEDYFENRRLLEDKYIRDIGRCVGNMLMAQRHCGAKHIVWFPFGMGAFLRNLPDLDNVYKNPEMLFALKKRIAEEFIRQFAQFPKLQIHLCVPMTKDKNDRFFEELNQTYNAFVLALVNAQDIKRRIHFYTNCDACDVAQELANKHGPFTVSLANGANRNLIGNHWFGKRALRAIDENLHRRSTLLAIAAYHLNNGFAHCNGEKGAYLARKVETLRGQVLKG